MRLHTFYQPHIQSVQTTEGTEIFLKTSNLEFLQVPQQETNFVIHFNFKDKIFTCSELAIGNLEKSVKYVQS